MSTELDWEFVKEFHPLPPSDRRVLLKTLGVDGVSQFDDTEFFGWLAERYQRGEGQDIDAAIRRKLSKWEERGLDPSLYSWLLNCTSRRRSRTHDQRVMCRSMVSEVLAKGGENAERLRALAPNFPWLELPAMEPAAVVDDGYAVENSAPSPLDEKAPSAEGRANATGLTFADDGEVLDRLATALVVLRQHPEPTLIDWAARLADAIETHASSLTSAAADAELLTQRRGRLAALFDKLDEAITERINAPAVEAMSLVMVERIETALTDLDAAGTARAQARAEAYASVDAPTAERNAAFAFFDEVAASYDTAIDRLAQEVADTKVQIGDLCDGSLTEPPESVRTDAAAVMSSTTTAPSDAFAPDTGADAASLEGDSAAMEQAPPPARADAAPLIAVKSPAPFDPATIELPAPDDRPHQEIDNPAMEPVAPSMPVAALPQWDGWILSALEQRKLGLALHLADGRHLSGADLPSSIPPVVLEGLLRSSTVHTAYSRFWIGYEELGPPLRQAAQDNHENKIATDLLLFAGAVRPAIVQSGAALSVIEALEGEVAAWVQPLRSVLGDVAQHHLGSVADIAAPPDLEARRAILDGVLKRLVEWRDAAPSRNTNYKPATAAWTYLISSDGPIGKAIILALGGKDGSAAQVQALVSALDDGVDRAIDDAHSLLWRGVRRSDIEGNARKQLRGLIATATALLGEWLDVQGVQVAREDRYQISRERLLVAMADARQTVAAAGCDKRSIAVVAGLFDIVLRHVEDQLRGVMTPALYPQEILDGEIALLAHFPLNARRGLRIEANDVEDLATAATLAFRDAALTAQTSFDEAVRLEAASSAIRLLDQLPVDKLKVGSDAVAQMTRQARRTIGERLAKLRQRLDDLQIATTAGNSELDELERAMTSFEQIVLEELPRDVGEPGAIADFPLAARELDRLERLLERTRGPLWASLEARITALEAKHGTTFDECRRQLDRGDLGTLSEEIDQIEAHGPAGTPDAAPLTLLTRFADLQRDLGDKPAFPFGSLPRAAREGANRDGFDFTGLSLLDRERAEALLDAWNALRRATQYQARRSEKNVDAAAKVAEALPAVLKALGWSGVRVTERKRETNWFWLSVSTVALRLREYCPIPAFGSECVTGKDNLAHYAVVVAGPDDVAACISSLENLPNTVLLFVTEPLNAQQRREIRRKARRSGHSIAVADAITIGMLATTPQAGTGQFFELAIPYGGAQPYADKETAIENFFGRDRELDTLLDPYGASFVYGGRQLGKTALLRQIELRQRDSKDHVAVYCYIKTVGESLSADAVWDKIRAALIERGLALPKSGPVPDQLRAWVQEKPGRYLLIMLDEADAFLESEMTNNFPQIEAMKTLMANTVRGIKFVFAGLHNVQRFYRAPNSPLLHLGAPVNVGPLLGSDRRAARQMALEPMAALGFAFKDTTDAYHMLSLIGFYPSLMQSFGKAVVLAMNKDIVRTSDAAPMPAVITRELIEACFRDPTFRVGVVERFQATLELDERYALITYAVWNRMQDESAAGRSTAFGFTAHEISRLARDWWPAGFAETDSLESFAAILDEMEEMGVLARKGDLYALRSQRIAAMLGGRAEIDRRLQELIDGPPRRRLDPMTSHRQVDRHWSPLTLRQETSLVKLLGDATGPRIVLVGATRAAGLSKIADALSSLTSLPRVDWPKPRQLRSTDMANIAAVAALVRRDAVPQQPRLVVAEGVWPSSETLLALRKDRALRETARPVRILICGVPTAEALAMPSVPELLQVNVGPLSNEGLQHWMNREQFGFADETRVQHALRDASGGWLEALDTIAITSALRRGGADALIEAARVSAARLNLADLGLEDDILSFARDLHAEVGDQAVPDKDLAVYASVIGDEIGAANLRLLEALGVVETAPTRGEPVMQAFNPVAVRLLA